MIGSKSIVVPVCRHYSCACVTYPASCKTTSNASWSSCARHGPNLQATLAVWVWEEGLGKQTAKAGPTRQLNGSAWMTLKLRKQTSKLAAFSTTVLLHQAIHLRLQALRRSSCQMLLHLHMLLHNTRADSHCIMLFHSCEKDPCCWQLASVRSLVNSCLHIHAVTNTWVGSAPDLLHPRVAALRGDQYPCKWHSLN